MHEHVSDHVQDGEQDARPAFAADVAPVQWGTRALDPGALLALQRSAGNAAVQRAISRDAAERPAEATAEDEAPAYRSPALLLRSQLRARSLLRAITTSGGEWDTETYDNKVDIDPDGKKAPAAQGWRGLDIKLKFKPNASVDAELIGMTQTAQTVIGGAPAFTPTTAKRSIPAGDAEPLNTGGAVGETDEGAHIDRAGGYNNPIYPVDDAASVSLDDTSTWPGWGEHGHHYTQAGVIKEHDAKLIDEPRAPGAAKDSRQIFETTALATKGAQAGTYYGSVRWGWRTDSAGTYTKLPFTKISEGVPSSTFLKSAEIWNPGKSSTGAANVDLPVPDVKVTTAAVTLHPPVPLREIPLPVGTRLQIVTDLVGPMLNGTVKVVDGPHTGVTGEITGAEWPNIADERS
jgi:hypothetical protein